MRRESVRDSQSSGRLPRRQTTANSPSNRTFGLSASYLPNWLHTAEYLTRVSLKIMYTSMS